MHSSRKLQFEQATLMVVCKFMAGNQAYSLCDRSVKTKPYCPRVQGAERNVPCYENSELKKSILIDVKTAGQRVRHIIFARKKAFYDRCNTRVAASL